MFVVVVFFCFLFFLLFFSFFSFFSRALFFLEVFCFVLCQRNNKDGVGNEKKKKIENKKKVKEGEREKENDETGFVTLSSP